MSFQLSLFKVLGCTALLAPSVVAQAVELRVSPAVRLGESLDFYVAGRPQQSFAILFDVAGGPRSFLGETIYLSLSSGLGVIESGTLGLGGFRVHQLPVTIGPTGLPIYWQAVALDAARPAGFTVSDGESSVLVASRGVLVDDILDPIAQGFSGEFDRNVTGRLRGLAARTRTVNVVPPGAIEFPAGIATPLSAAGSRMQMVIRPGDLSATGEPERLSAIRWYPGGRLPVTADVFRGMAIDVAHSLVAPDYTIDPWTGLPQFPASGLSQTFASNITPGQSATRVFAGDYVIDPSARRPDGYVPFPPISGFDYDGRSSLLLDFKVPPDAQAIAANGLRVFLTVQSSERPNSRVLATGGQISGPPTVDPFTITQAVSGDNAYYDLQLEFAREVSVVESRWLASPVASPIYGQAIVSASIPPGTAVDLEFRGATNAMGGGATAWIRDPQRITGQPFLQYRVTFRTALGAPIAASVDQVVIPIR
ncbi:MAG: hypothetical protein AB7I19_13135 [Planctomycetota bacterium]